MWLERGKCNILKFRERIKLTYERHQKPSTGRNGWDQQLKNGKKKWKTIEAATNGFSGPLNAVLNDRRFGGHKEWKK